MPARVEANNSTGISKDANSSRVFAGIREKSSLRRKLCKIRQERRESYLFLSSFGVDGLEI
jgi:hypothetical protein